MRLPDASGLWAVSQPETGHFDTLTLRKPKAFLRRVKALGSGLWTDATTIMGNVAVLVLALTLAHATLITLLTNTTKGKKGQLTELLTIIDCLTRSEPTATRVQSPN